MTTSRPSTCITTFRFGLRIEHNNQTIGWKPARTGVQFRAMPEPGKEGPPEVRPVPRDAAERSAEQLSRGLWRLRLPVPYSSRGTVNCYLLEGAEGPCLIDCGTSLAPGWDALEHAL